MSNFFEIENGLCDLCIEKLKKSSGLFSVKGRFIDGWTEEKHNKWTAFCEKKIIRSPVIQFQLDEGGMMDVCKKCLIELAEKI